MNTVDDDIVKEFLEYYSGAVIPNPDHYPKQFKFMIDAFLYHKSMEKEDGKN